MYQFADGVFEKEDDLIGALCPIKLDNPNGLEYIPNCPCEFCELIRKTSHAYARAKTR